MYGRFSNWGALPPDNNGDFAWLFHIIACMKDDGHASVVLLLGVLLRGKSEQIIRSKIVKRGYITHIAVLAPNQFFGTGIPVCIISLSKGENKDGICFIDGSTFFVKDKDKNRMNEKHVKLTGFQSREFHDNNYILFGDHTCVLKYIECSFAQGADGLKVLSSADERKYLPKYIYYAMSTVDIPPSYDRHWGTMSDAKVFIPSFSEQQRIASIMSNLDDNIAKQQEKLDKDRKLKDALLNDLISGKIRLLDEE